MSGTVVELLPGYPPEAMAEMAHEALDVARAARPTNALQRKRTAENVAQIRDFIAEVEAYLEEQAEAPT